MKFMKVLLFLLTMTMCFAGCDLVNSNKPNELNRIGIHYSEEGQKKKAINYFLAASLTKNITDSERTIYLGNLGREYWQSNEDSSKYYFMKAANLSDKNSFKGLYYTANVFVLDKKTTQARDLLLKAYQIDSLDMSINNLLGIIYMGENGRECYAPQKALKYNLRTYNVKRDLAAAFTLAKNYYLINDTKKAVPLFEDVCKRAPDFTPCLSILIMVYQELGRNKDADKLLIILKQKDLPRYNQIIKLNIKKGEHGLNWYSE